MYLYKYVFIIYTRRIRRIKVADCIISIARVNNRQAGASHREP
jgi:hypothetical protein